MIKLQASSLQSGLRDCNIDGKFQILFFWVQESFCPKTRRPSVRSPSVQIPGIHAPRVQANARVQEYARRLQLFQYTH